MYGVFLVYLSLRPSSRKLEPTPVIRMATPLIRVIEHQCCDQLTAIKTADQYHLTVPWAQVSTHRGRVFFEVIR